METQLTLTMEESLVEKAKDYAEKDGEQSLSFFVENYFKTVLKDKPNVIVPKDSITHSLRGAFEEPENSDYKKDLQDAICEKYDRKAKIGE